MDGLGRVEDVPGLVRADILTHGAAGNLAGEFIEVGGVPAVWFWAQRPSARPAWYRDASAMLDRELDVWTRDCGLLVALEVDGVVYTVTYGDGWRWIRDEHHSPAFGLKVVVRCLDQSRIRAVGSRRLGLGRSDNTVVAGGAPLAAVRPSDYLDVIRKLAGEAVDLGLTHGRRDRDGVERATLDGSAGLRGRFGVRGDDLVADIRRVASIAARQVPPELEFVETVIEAGKTEVGQLDALLERNLTGSEPENSVAVAIPDAALPHVGREHGYRMTRGHDTFDVEELTADDVLTTFRPHRSGASLLAALRRGRIAMLDEDRRNALYEAPAQRWIESVQFLDDVAYYLMDGAWYRFEAGYADRVRAECRAAFANATLSLPPWHRLSDGTPEPEGTYNERAAGEGGFVCLDKKLLRSELYRRSGLEACDLLGDDGTLIHVKRAKGASALSHLFAQGLNAAEALIADHELRRAFRGVVTRTAADRSLPADLVPTRLVFAVVNETHPVTAQNLYPLSAATLAHVMARLAGRVVVSVVPIDLASASDDQAA
ncbi:MAG: TIGR04141 family sporadically distributed protein [Actinobacteria bacterium]|nr:TIGR04141 family sporadically distributed protein [Actinomycetota bacterium]